jgi:hypothetical protein
MAKNKPGRDGRGSYERHVRLPHTLTGSPAWHALRGSSIKVYVALARYNVGDNNGSLFFSIETGMAETGLARNTVAASLRQLEDHGFIAAVEKGYFRQKGGPASRWRLTHLPAPGCRPHIPTNEWQRWQSAENGNKTRSQFLTATVAVFESDVETLPATVSKTDTSQSATPLVSVGPSISKTDTQIVCHRHSAAKGRKQGGNTLEIAGGVSGNGVDPSLLERLRSMAQAYLDQDGVGGLTRLADAVPVHKGTLSKFLHGGSLNRTHFINLQLALQKQPQRRAA